MVTRFALIERPRPHWNDKTVRSEVTVFHPETAYEFAKERQLKLEQAAQEGSIVFAFLGQLVRRLAGDREQVA